MKRKVLSVLLSTAMLMGTLAGCGNSASTQAPAADNSGADTAATTDAAATAETPAPASEGAIRLVNGKIEIDNALKQLANELLLRLQVQVSLL